MSGTELILYYMPTCPYCQKVTDFIEENNIEKIEFKNTFENPDAKEKLIEVGGKDQVPCLFIDGEPLYESDDIINWLKQNIVD